MLTSHELFGFMPADLSNDILEFAFENERELYKATSTSVANARKVRPVFFERQPRSERNKQMAVTLGKPGQELAAGTLLRTWLLKKHKSLLIDFLDGLGIPHKEGTVDDLPATVDNLKLKNAIETILQKHPSPVVAVYLNAFSAMNETKWPNLDAALQSDKRLQF
ncbi:MAG TPA: hypothetical protein VK968_15695 [Roseimicrobium sp.]|nr:hypothetical protein [Roseimicrobium sp.]